MGIENRDYARGSGTSYGFSPPTQQLWAWKYLLIANIVVFFLQMATNDERFPKAMQGGITDWLSLNLSNLVNDDWTKGFQIWRLLTCGFCHASFNHILFNMIALWIFGRMIEPVYGSKEFLLFFLSGVVISSLCHVGMQAFQQSPDGVYGASGGVMAIVFLTAMTYPRMEMLLMLVIPVQLRFLAILYAAVDIFGAFSGGGSVAHVAHLGGAAFGVGYKYFDWRLSGLWAVISSRFHTGWKRRTGPKMKIYRPSEPSAEEMKQKVDKILEKIHTSGEASLTNKERTFLSDASRRYRDQ